LGAAFDDLDVDEEFHEDLFVDLLDGLITRRGGSYRRVAARAGYSERYLRFILAKERPIPPATLARLIDALPFATASEVRALRDFARHARPRDTKPSGAVRQVMDANQAAAELRRLLDLNHLAMHSEIAETTRRGIRDVRRDVGRVVAGIQNLAADPPTAAHLYVLLCNVLNVGDDPGDGLRAARLARTVIERHLAAGGTTSPRLDALWVEAVRAEAMSFHNLQMDRHALERYRVADQALATHPRDPQRTYVALSRISSLIKTRRFRIGDVRSLVEEVYRACDHGLFSELETTLLVLQAGQGLLGGLIRRGDVHRREARRLLLDELDRLPDIAFAGPLHDRAAHGTNGTGATSYTY
jgi:hypothetical protein